MFNFKNFLQKFVSSIDSSFNETDIEEAYYRSYYHGSSGEALIFLRSEEAAIEIETKLHNLELRKMFPGSFEMSWKMLNFRKTF